MNEYTRFAKGRNNEKLFKDEIHDSVYAMASNQRGGLKLCKDAQKQTKTLPRTRNTYLALASRQYRVRLTKRKCWRVQSESSLVGLTGCLSKR